MASFLGKIKSGFAKTRTQVFDKIATAITAKRKIDDELLEEIEEILISGDVGVDASIHIVEQIKQRAKRQGFEDSEQLLELLEDEIASIFPESNFDETEMSAKPYVILVVGVNGTGKTTTIAKLSGRLKNAGHTVLLAAADTFRAAAIDQLEEWANRLDIEMVKHHAGSDPAAVAFDAVQAAVARQTDVLVIDTAGRLHTKSNLMEELKKIRRVIEKSEASAPHLTLLVLDATTGQNALAQARQFIDTVGVNGIVLTKLDGTAKGGAVIGIVRDLEIPVEYIGLGEQLDDLQPFDARTYAAGLFQQDTTNEG